MILIREYQTWGNLCEQVLSPQLVNYSHFLMAEGPLTLTSVNLQMKPQHIPHHTCNKLKL